MWMWLQSNQSNGIFIEFIVSIIRLTLFTLTQSFTLHHSPLFPLEVIRDLCKPFSLSFPLHNMYDPWSDHSSLGNPRISSCPFPSLHPLTSPIHPFPFSFPSLLSHDRKDRDRITILLTLSPLSLLLHLRTWRHTVSLSLSSLRESISR